MSIVQHPMWPELAPYIRIEMYGRDGGPDTPRHRIEVVPPDRDTSVRWQALEMPCVACHRLMHPIRARAPAKNTRGWPRHLYYAATCPLDVRKGCSKGKAAEEEYDRVKEAVGVRPSRPKAPLLF